MAPADGTPPLSEVTREDIATTLRDLGLSAGDGVMVHSSLKSLGRVAGGAAAVIEALMQVLTPEGTLMMPSFNHGEPFWQGGPGLCDPRSTPTTNGVIPDLFWRLPGVCRSLDPTHSIAAWGRSARRYTQFHHRTLTMGPESPLGLLGREGGLGLFIGVTYKVNTYHHVVETTLGAPCLGRRTESYPVRIPVGGWEGTAANSADPAPTDRIVQGRTWGWRERGCPITDSARYEREMVARGRQKETIVGACRAILFRLSDCFDVIAQGLNEGMDGFPPCRLCPIRPRQVQQTVPSDWDEQHQRLMPDSEAWTY
jgi:aminoglycoside N3'-acetyltransferase